MQQLQRVIRGDYKIPSRVKISDSCRELLDRILQVNVAKRITIPEILKHKWCTPEPLYVLPAHLTLGAVLEGWRLLNWAGAGLCMGCKMIWMLLLLVPINRKALAGKAAQAAEATPLSSPT